MLLGLFYKFCAYFKQTYNCYYTTIRHIVNMKQCCYYKYQPSQLYFSYKSIKNILLCFTAISLITACGLQNNISVTLTQGNCPNGVTNAPYCMGVTLNSNSGGQNWITSTNYPVSNLSISISGNVNNIILPTGTSSSEMDPNQCFNNSKIQPGGSCTFYLAITQESYPVNGVESATVTLNYTYNTDLFGSSDSGTSASYSFPLFEYTNLYIIENYAGSNNLGLISMYNANGLQTLNATLESSASIKTFIVDNSTYGYLYTATNNQFYMYGNSNNAVLSESGVTIPNGITTMFNQYPSPISPTVAGSNYTYVVSASNMYRYNFTSWTFSTLSYATIPSNILSNAGVLSSYPILVGNSPSVLYVCGFGTSNTCSIDSAATSSSIADIALMSIVPSNTTGIYAATSSGLYLESGAIGNGTSNSWTVVANTSSNNMTAVTSDSFGNVYASDNSGNLYKINYLTGTTAAVYAYNTNGIGNYNVSSMVYDNFANLLYVMANSYLYVCNLASSAPQCTQASTSSFGSVNIIGMGIGSQLATDTTF